MSRISGFFEVLFRLPGIFLYALFFGGIIGVGFGCAAAVLGLLFVGNSQGFGLPVLFIMGGLSFVFSFFAQTSVLIKAISEKIQKDRIYRMINDLDK